MFSPGTRIRDYEVWGRLGGGGMGDVWLARHVVLASPVIIKTLKPELGGSAQEREQRVVTEARLMARIHSANVVRALDVGSHQGMPYVVQEYVDGIDLNELDHSRRDSLGLGLPLWFACDAAAQIARGLRAAHQYGILHRDLKPSNLFGSADGTVKLGDFGVAVPTQISEKKLCGSAGTLRFMPPEALRGEALDRHADVYGLGATIFDLRYGSPPFLDARELLDTPDEARFPPAQSAEEAFFQHVIAKMIAKNPGQRYADLGEPQRALAALAQSTSRPLRASKLGTDRFVLDRVQVFTEAGDIANVETDGIVSSANWQLGMRTGVGEALRRVGGDEIEAEALGHGEQPLGACIATGPGRLRARRVLHAVSAWEEASCIGRATQRVLLLAERLGLRRLAIPALGTGAARVTLEVAAQAQASALSWHLSLGGSRLEEVRFVLYDDAKLRVFREVLKSELFGLHLDTGLDAGLASAARGPTDPTGPTLLDTARS